MTTPTTTIRRTPWPTRVGSIRVATGAIAVGAALALSACNGGAVPADQASSQSSETSNSPTSGSTTASSSATSESTSASSSTAPASTASTAPLTATTIVGSGVDATRTYPLSGFKAIDVAAFGLTVTKGDTFSVAVTADDNVFDRLVVEVRNGTLRLGIAKETSLRQVTLRAVVTLPEVDALDGAGSASVTMSGFSTDILRTIDLSGASHLEADLRSSQLRLTASGASTAVLRGGATDLLVELGGASSTTATEFPVVNADVSLSGASQAQLQVTGQIRSADLSGASSLRYGGTANVTGVQTSGGSTISRG